MKRINLYISILALFIFIGCNDSEEDMLGTKIYFENTQIKIDAEDIDSYECEVISRLSNFLKGDVNVEYRIGDNSLVEAYNLKNGTTCLPMPAENFTLTTTNAVIKAGDIYSAPNQIQLKNLLKVEEGLTYVIPVVMTAEGAPMMSGSDVVYVVVKKPISITKVQKFNGKYLDVTLPASAKSLSSLTFETLLYTTYYKVLSTVMGNEGILILRFSDLKHPANELQIAGKISVIIPEPDIFQTNKWYHVAFTYDSDTGMATIYVNGEKIIAKNVGDQTFNLNERFCIGYAYDYDPNRTWPGYMSECRLWTVARTANQLRDNMMYVDPNTEGLMGYWKMNGTDVEKRDDGYYYVKDQTKNKLDAKSRKGRRGEPGYSEGGTVEPEIVDMKVKIE
ncbi:DUF1735 and LamG domain-containing protein [Bacteroides stercorirosoris]|jgi:uncharacterized protein YcfL|uniref:Concanavalin A-like lectin/glucanases superfamily protein n=1 Tax=Bacteroides stercorirosoris TaxID=871324 RepID=A0A1M6IHC4_9BACE|nr:DUF1735 and LamG domain-containing protein [Bacteroides stercorirosoris]OKZ10644.1 MAG: hypothetical protein BHV75_09780 [Bacteroides oleiciplenus]RGX79652.1 DUF1735 domain-containing protein [Bacteroides stercorirosoris]SHJ33766.1 Concanavalin A-like lectin/glucanases superfamily protein [Bacteroides stercorirosoris]